jgi:hypothetical protein
MEAEETITPLRDSVKISLDSVLCSQASNVVDAGSDRDEFLLLDPQSIRSLKYHDLNPQSTRSLYFQR